MRKRRNYTANRAKKDGYDADDLRALFSKFTAIKTAEGIAEGTMQQYRNNFKFFCEYIERMGGDYHIGRMTTDFIRDWITYMQRDHVQFQRVQHRAEKAVGLKPATINTRIKTLRVMFNTLYRERLIENNPMENVSNVNEPEELIETLTADELRRLLGVMDKSYYTDYRDYVLTTFLLDTMMRISEAVTLRRDDVRWDDGLAIIRASVAKSRVARVVPVSKRVLRLLSELMKENAQYTDSPYIFATDSGTHYDRNTYNQRLKSYADMAHINKRVHAHIFRHTAATTWLESGGGIEELRKILGHSKYEMVKRYAHVSNTSIQQAARKYSITSQLDDL